MAEKKLRFRAKIQGKEAGVVAAITPPVDVVEWFGTRARVPIRGTINGFPFRSSLMPMGGCHMMPVNKILCQGAGVKPGDTVDVVMERDAEARSVEAPPELKRELAKSKKAQERWDELAFTHKKEMANSISGAKQEETKKRRLAKVMEVLRRERSGRDRRDPGWFDLCEWKRVKIPTPSTSSGQALSPRA
jgi:Domain of unknown function (DUF1905)/Bacteriocin-protection, YdeI or OmpD-Associated